MTEAAETASRRAADQPKAAEVRPRSGGLGRKMIWTSADQVVSSATNAVVSFLVARQVGADAFGSFSVAFVTFAFVSGLSRALVTDALLIRFSAADRARRRFAVADAAGAMVLVGAVSAAVCACIGLMTDGLTGAVFVALAVVLPGLLLQGAWRQGFFADGRPAAAFVNDLVWAVLQVGGLLVMSRFGRTSVVELILVWGAAAAVASAVGGVQAGTRPHLRGGVNWLKAHRGLSGQLATDFAISQGAANLAAVLVGVVAGIASVGSIRGAQVLAAPAVVLFSSLTSFALPLLSRRVTDGHGLRRQAVQLSALGAGVTLAWTFLLLLVPPGLGRAMLGATWVGTRDVLALVGLQWTVIGVALGATLALKAQARAATLLRLTMVQAPLMLGLGAAGAYLDGARGAVAGWVVAQLVGACLNWVALLRGPEPASLAPKRP